MIEYQTGTFSRDLQSDRLSQVFFNNDHVKVKTLLPMPAHALKQHRDIGNKGATLWYQQMSVTDGVGKMYSQISIMVIFKS